MSGQYINVTQTEMETLLFPLGFQRVRPSRTSELVYGKRVDQDGLPLTLRIYTGINPDGQSRDVGEDAMRVNLFMGVPKGNDPGTGKPVWDVVKLGGSKRVHRIAPSKSNPTGWRGNLKCRIDAWTEYLPPHRCPKCSNPMLVRNGRSGQFLGCAGYPNCKHTAPLDKPER